MCFITAFPIQIFAFPHGYKRHTDEIYATVRHDLTVYGEEHGEEPIDYIPSFTGIRVTYVGDAWRQIEYMKKGEQRTGWITSDEFYASCLFYDGREKQSLADGDYNFYCAGRKEPLDAIVPDLHPERAVRGFLLPLRLTFKGNRVYSIMRTDTREYLQPDSVKSKNHFCRWGDIDHAGNFYITRKDDYYFIRDQKTKYTLRLDKKGLLRFHNGRQLAMFSVTRTSGKALDPAGSLRCFAQYDAEWADDYYGDADRENSLTNNFSTSACGIFATMNAIYTLTGKYINPHILADYAVKKDFRVEDNGTDSGIFRSAARQFGKSYGFRYDGEADTIKALKNKLQKGDVAIGHVPGHYIAIVDYNRETKRFLLLDSHYLPKRKTCPYGDWVRASDLEGDTYLYAAMYHFYRPVK